jgi:transposase
MLSLFLMALYLAVMNVSFQLRIASPTVGSNRASRGNCLSNEPVQVGAGCIWYRSQANAPDALCILLGGDDTLGHLLALHVMPADEQDRARVAEVARQVQQITEENVELAYVDQGYTGKAAEEAAAQHGIRLEVVMHTEAKRGFVLLPRRWVVERRFA